MVVPTLQCVWQLIAVHVVFFRHQLWKEEKGGSKKCWVGPPHSYLTGLCGLPSLHTHCGRNRRATPCQHKHWSRILLMTSPPSNSLSSRNCDSAATSSKHTCLYCYVTDIPYISSHQTRYVNILSKTNCLRRLFTALRARCGHFETSMMLATGCPLQLAGHRAYCGNKQSSSIHKYILSNIFTVKSWKRWNLGIELIRHSC